MCSPALLNNQAPVQTPIQPTTTRQDKSLLGDKSLSSSPRSILDESPGVTNKIIARGHADDTSGWGPSQEGYISGGNDQTSRPIFQPRNVLTGDPDNNFTGPLPNQTLTNREYRPPLMDYTPRDPNSPGKPEQFIEDYMNTDFEAPLRMTDRQKARYDEDKRVKLFRGFESTILTGGLGITTPANSRQLTLIGS